MNMNINHLVLKYFYATTTIYIKFDREINNKIMRIETTKDEKKISLLYNLIFNLTVLTNKSRKIYFYEKKIHLLNNSFADFFK